MAEKKKFKDEKQECNSLACSKTRKFKDVSIGTLAWVIIVFIIVLIVGIILLAIFVPTMDLGSMFDFGSIFEGMIPESITSLI